MCMTKEHSNSVKTRKKTQHYSKTLRQIPIYLRKDDPLNFVWDSIEDKHAWFVEKLTRYARKHPEIFRNKDL